MFKLKDLDKALALYNQALETDHDNELSLANKSLIELKKEKYTDCIESCEAAIKQIDKFTHYTNFNQEEK